jgi:AraC family transcriptional regulator of adaptative response / DNA-3-methyladenine glycosylase II
MCASANERDMDDDARYRALSARDARFDGLFFVGVTTTGIYCRPVCRARLPGRTRCVFFKRSAEAERAGYRACFRCRPELAPGAAHVDAVSTLARRATTRIEAGALNDHSIDDLARELHVSARHLRRAVTREIGVSPVDLAQSCRLALAKQLLHAGDMSIVDVAHASGFGSVRRFNAVFHSRFGRAPSRVGSRSRRGTANVVTMTLGYRAPFAWRAMLEFLSLRAIPGVEQVDLDKLTYGRTVRFGDRCGSLLASADSSTRTLRVDVSASLSRSLMEIAVAVRRLFDLDADPHTIDPHLARDVALRACVRASPGLRVPGAFDAFELAARAVMGQQISVRAATTIAGRLAHAFGEPIQTPSAGLNRLFPTAARLAGARADTLRTVGLTGIRARTLRNLAAAVDRGTVELEGAHSDGETIASLEAVDGIGPWTAQYVAMRALHAPDAFPSTDLGLLRALAVTPRALGERSRAWSPWRAYAAMHLWRGAST